MTSALIQIADHDLMAQMRKALPALGIQVLEPGAQANPSAVLRSMDYEDSKPPPAPVVLLMDTPRGERMHRNPFTDRGVRHFLSIHPTFDPHYLRTTLEQVAEHDFIRLPLLLGEDAHTIVRQANTSDEKNELISELVEFLQGEDAERHINDNLITSLDELYTNAVYNAPVAGGTHENLAKPRTEKVTSERPITVKFAVDSKHWALSVRDGYGSLEIDTVLNNLHRCFETDKARHSNKAGGAGLGFFVLLQNSSRLVINISPGQSTEVIVLAKRGERRRAFLETAPCMSICVPPEELRARARRHRRHTVRWPSVCKVEDTSTVATIMDASADE